MPFLLKYDHLTPVLGTVRAGLVSYNGNDPEHRAALREALPRFLGSLGAVHGEIFPEHHINDVIAVCGIYTRACIGPYCWRLQPECGAEKLSPYVGKMSIQITKLSGW